MGYGGERERGKSRKGEGERNGGREEVGRDRSCLFEREMEKEETQAASRKEDLPASADRGVGVACLLKRQDRPVQEGLRKKIQGISSDVY